MNRFLLVDGHAFAFKAYYAFEAVNLKNSTTGLPSGAVFGFFRMIFKILQEYKSSHIAITFDPGTPLERNKIYELYKANRKPTPEDLKPQIQQIIEMCEYLQFPVFRISGHEADDIIGTLAKKIAGPKTEVFILSSDKDMYQLLNEHVTILRGTKGVSDFIKVDGDWVKREIGVTVEQIVDYMGITGDDSDNIPGVMGIGKKGASTLLSQFKTIDDIYKNISLVKSDTIRKKLVDGKQLAFLSRELATIKTDLPINVQLDDLKIPNYLSIDKIQYFKQTGFNALHKDLLKQAGLTDTPEIFQTEVQTPSIPNKPVSIKGKYKRIKTQIELQELVQILKKQEIICFDTETTSVHAVSAELLGIAFSFQECEAFYVPVIFKDSMFPKETFPIQLVIDSFKDILENPNIKKIGQNIKYDILVLKKYNIDVKNIYFDTMVASYILVPEGRRHNMDSLAMEYLNYKTITYSELVGTGKKKKELYEIDLDNVSDYACEDADITYRLYLILKSELERQKMDKIFYELEMPLVEVLSYIENNGVSIHESYLQQLSIDYQIKLEGIESRIHQIAKKKFNIASTKELQVILFDELKLPTDKKTKTGFSTDHAVLEILLGKHPIIENLLEHRKYAKLKSTYIDALPRLIYPETNKIHTSYNQTVVATGRLSSTDPNLQNIPIKEAEGSLIRRAFVPSSNDFVLLSLDYSQIELRIMAHFSKDPKMLDAYHNNLDIHKRTASGIFNVPENQVNSEMRNKAKVVNFSLIYGAGSFNLSQSLNISRREADQYIERYFEQFPNIKKYMDEIVESCKKNGYVETLTGRRRYIPEIHSSNKMDQASARRIAINSPIQGTSADMIKIAMTCIYNRIYTMKLKSKLIMQVHDELVFDVYKDEKDELYQIAKVEMETALKLNVPVVVEGKFGQNWQETK